MEWLQGVGAVVGFVKKDKFGKGGRRGVGMNRKRGDFLDLKKGREEIIWVYVCGAADAALWDYEEWRVYLIIV